MEREVQRGAQRGVGRTSRGVHGGLCGEFQSDKTKFPAGAS